MRRHFSASLFMFFSLSTLSSVALSAESSLHVVSPSLSANPIHVMPSSATDYAGYETTYRVFDAPPDATIQIYMACTGPSGSPPCPGDMGSRDANGVRTYATIGHTNNAGILEWQHPYWKPTDVRDWIFDVKTLDGVASSAALGFTVGPHGPVLFVDNWSVGQAAHVRMRNFTANTSLFLNKWKNGSNVGTHVWVADGWGAVEQSLPVWTMSDIGTWRFLGSAPSQIAPEVTGVVSSAIPALAGWGSSTAALLLGIAGLVAMRRRAIL